MTARRTELSVFVNGIDISTTAGGYIKSLLYTDNEEDKTDDLQLELDDKDEEWQEWLEGIQGADIRATIIQQETGGESGELDCGTFELDADGLAGPPAVVALKGTSLPHTSTIRTETRTKAWENILLSVIANEIAGSHGLECIFESSVDPFYTRREQIETSDIVFLQRLCNNAGISLKATDKKLVLFRQQDYEAKDTVMEIVKGSADVLRYGFSGETKDCNYAGCQVIYTDPQTGETIESTFTAPGATGNQILRINEKVSNAGEANDVAKARLRDKNKNAKKAKFTLVGSIRLVASVTVKVSGWGKYDGKYIVEQTKHNVAAGGGYTVKIKTRKVLEGY